MSFRYNQCRAGEVDVTMCLSLKTFVITEECISFSLLYIKILNTTKHESKK